MARRATRLASRTLIGAPVDALTGRRSARHPITWVGALVLLLVLPVPAGFIASAWPALSWLPFAVTTLGVLTMLRLVGSLAGGFWRSLGRGLQAVGSLPGAVGALVMVGLGALLMLWLITNDLGWLLAPAAGSWLFTALLLAMAAGRKRDRGARKREAAFRAVLGGPESAWEGRTRQQRDGSWVAVAPGEALIAVETRPELDLRTAAYRRDLELVRVSQNQIQLRKASRETLARRRLAASSGGLVVAISSPSESGARTLSLGERVRGTRDDVEQLTAWIDRELATYSVVSWRAGSRTALVAALDEESRALRSMAAAAVPGVQFAHQVSVSVTRNEGGHRRIVVTGEQLLAIDRTARRRAAAELRTRLPNPAKDLDWQMAVDDRAGTIILQERVDPLGSMLPLAAFRERFPLGADPATSWRRFPVAIDEHDRAVDLAMFHTLCVGQTGAGKGSVIWSILGGVAPTAREGLAEFYAIDPKGAEAIAEDGGPHAAFRQVATTPEEWAPLLAHLVTVLNSRKGRGRSLPVTREMPLIVLLIDEMSAVTLLDTDAKRARQVAADLLIILSQGRSLNLLVIGAVQVPQKEMVGRQRDFMPMRVALRTSTPLETDLVLGEGATDAGAAAHEIEVAGPGNGYRSAGTGYMRIDGDPQPRRIRFPYTSDKDLQVLHEEFAALRAAGALPPQIASMPDAADADTPVFGRRIDADDEIVDAGILDLGEIDFAAKATPPTTRVSTSALNLGLDFS